MDTDTLHTTYNNINEVFTISDLKHLFINYLGSLVFYTFKIEVFQDAAFLSKNLHSSNTYLQINFTRYIDGK
jgi:hypothetical protein